MKTALLTLFLVSQVEDTKEFVGSISPKSIAATGAVYGKEVNFELERIPLRDMKDRPLWFRKGKPAEALLDMIAYANSHGYEIKINSAYRTHKHQKELWLRMPDIAGKPGEGGWRTHQTGCAVDISGTIKEVDGEMRKTILFWWLNRFGHKFHFYNTIPNEPWHWTYMGPIDDEDIEVGGD